MEEIEEIPWYRGPLKIIIGLFLILIIIVWVFPHYGVKQNPSPERTPSLAELGISEMTIPEIGSADIRDYVRTDAEIKRVADKIVSLSCERTHRVCNAKAIFYFVQNNFDYVNDPLAYEYFKTPQESLQSTIGDCDDGSILVASLLRSIGFDTRFVFVPGHVYIQAKIPEAASSVRSKGDWVNLDSTCRDCSFGEISYRYSEVEKRFLE